MLGKTGDWFCNWDTKFFEQLLIPHSNSKVDFSFLITGQTLLWGVFELQVQVETAFAAKQMKISVDFDFIPSPA